MIRSLLSSFDLDGTLADLNGRKPFGKTLREDCVNDLCIEPIAQLTRIYKKFTGIFVLIVSGRSDEAKMETIGWLHKNNIMYDRLFMRKEGDFRADEILKEEMYRELVEPYFDVILVFDDRPKVIRMWRDIGLKVADVGKGVEF